MLLVQWLKGPAFNLEVDNNGKSKIGKHKI